MPLGFVSECVCARIALFFAFVVLVVAVVVAALPGVSSVRETS